MARAAQLWDGAIPVESREQLPQRDQGRKQLWDVLRPAAAGQGFRIIAALEAAAGPEIQQSPIAGATESRGPSCCSMLQRCCSSRAGAAPWAAAGLASSPLGDCQEEGQQLLDHRFVITAPLFELRQAELETQGRGSRADQLLKAGFCFNMAARGQVALGLCRTRATSLAVAPSSRGTADCSAQGHQSPARIDSVPSADPAAARPAARRRAASGRLPLQCRRAR